MSFVGGKLNLKGSGKKKKGTKKKKRHDKHERESEKYSRETSTIDDGADGSEDENLTEAEKAASKFKSAAEKRELEKVGNRSHRERVEAYNSHLSTLTEHNDIPRVSAAGNG
mmetsp:Transcript_16203/g.36454  ORF Transcript_16203/g.36454 Transcript_16203/m.36454 type:complete len:112 (+) Transcript_16203:145-480(+)